MPYRVEFRASVLRDVRRLPVGLRNRVRAATDRLAGDPRPSGCIKLHGGSGLWRIRVGDWRVIYAIDDAARVVTVTTIGHRGDV